MLFQENKNAVTAHMVCQRETKQQCITCDIQEPAAIIVTYNQQQKTNTIKCLFTSITDNKVAHMILISILKTLCELQYN